MHSTFFILIREVIKLLKYVITINCNLWTFEILSSAKWYFVQHIWTSNEVDVFLYTFGIVPWTWYLIFELDILYSIFLSCMEYHKWSRCIELYNTVKAMLPKTIASTSASLPHESSEKLLICKIKTFDIHVDIYPSHLCLHLPI